MSGLRTSSVVSHRAATSKKPGKWSLLLRNVAQAHPHRTWSPALLVAQLFDYKGDSTNLHGIAQIDKQAERQAFLSEPDRVAHLLFIFEPWRDRVERLQFVPWLSNLRL